MCAASAEMDGRPGPVRDRVAGIMMEWLAVLETNVNAAIIAGDVSDEADPHAVAFRLNALGMAANWQEGQLLSDLSGIAHARSASGAELDRLSTDSRAGND